jgi:hypothetical protein
MLHEIKFEWKPFAVELSDFDRWLHANAPGYKGMSADYTVHIYLDTAPSDDLKARLEQYWNSLTAEVEAAKIAHRDKLTHVVKYAKDNLPYIDMMAMSPAERKLFMGRELTLQDKEDLVAKYPNV